jgi:hypothetical protein|tara:strand:- start:25 stop:138 length:114 start_codon:yes stop_codon:yes gene_type:complete
MADNWEDGFNNFIKEMEEKEQPTCNIDNQEDCDSCGS